MLQANRHRANNQLDNAVGGIANETRFDGKGDYAGREHRVFNVPALGVGIICAIEQGWNRIARKADVIRLTLHKSGARVEGIFRRKDLEQALFAMAQGDEAIKYLQASARRQRDFSNLPNKRNL